MIYRKYIQKILKPQVHTIDSSYHHMEMDFPVNSFAAPMITGVVHNLMEEGITA